MYGNENGHLLPSAMAQGLGLEGLVRFLAKQNKNYRIIIVCW